MDHYGNCPKNTQCQYGKGHEICCSAASDLCLLSYRASRARRFPVRLLKVITPHNSLPLKCDLPLVMRFFLPFRYPKRNSENATCVAVQGSKRVSPALAHVKSFPGEFLGLWEVLCLSLFSFKVSQALITFSFT